MTSEQPGPQRPNSSSLRLTSLAPAPQERLYRFLLDIVKVWEPEPVLRAFEQLFIYQTEVADLAVLRAVHEIVLTGDRQQFFYCLRRCCFILINNWGSARLYEPIHELIELFSLPAIGTFTPSPPLKKLRQWLKAFVASQDYGDLKVFAERYSDGDGRWSQRYMSYLLVPQYFDNRNPAEQRRAARILSKELRDRFRFDLAMYVAHSQVRSASTTLQALENRTPSKNPTTLGDDVLQLIKTIVLRRGQYGYENLASLFKQQTAGVTFQDYKLALIKYLLFSVKHKGFVQILLQRLSKRLEELMPERNGERINEELIFLTSNRVIEFLTTEDGETPAPLFSLLISQGGPLTLVIVLLKLVLIAPKTRNRLEFCIAKLIQHYDALRGKDCTWFIHFLEIFSVTFAIYVEDVQYNLVHIPSPLVEGSEAGPNPVLAQAAPDLDDYRIFSQRRGGAERLVGETAQQIEGRLHQLSQQSSSPGTGGDAPAP